MRPFGKLYSRYYDLIYSDKDYVAECTYIESILARWSRGPVNSILELGAGTGGYSVVLGKRGYSVLGIDRSKFMLDIAKAKAAREHLGSTVKFMSGDIRALKLTTSFDACICMFDVMNYLGSVEEIKLCCRQVSGSLRKGGLLIFDYWSGPALLSIGPSQRHKVVRSGGTTVIRVSDPTMYNDERKVRVLFRTFVIEKKLLVEEFSESHEMRYLFPEEVAEALRDSGFRLLSTHPFMDRDAPVSDHDWNVTSVAMRE